MSDKMREEFEVWLSVFLNDADIEDIASARSVDTDGSTVYFFPDDESTMGITAMWIGWQASRAELVIELPTAMDGPDGDGLDGNYEEFEMHEVVAGEVNCMLAKCRAAIEAAGIKVKS